MPTSHTNRRPKQASKKPQVQPAQSEDQPEGGACPIYRPEYASIAKAMCELGATDADLAKAFGVDQSVIGLWKVTHKEFSESSRLGAGCADERVEQSLHQRAAGYEYVARKVTSHKGQSAIVEYPVHVPADVAAGKYWLLNRQSSRWKDQSKIEPDPNEDSPLMPVARMLSGTGLKPKE